MTQAWSVMVPGDSYCTACYAVHTPAEERICTNPKCSRKGQELQRWIKRGREIKVEGVEQARKVGNRRSTYSPETERQLDLWVQAKRTRDYEQAINIQRELKAKGVDAEEARPDPRKVN